MKGSITNNNKFWPFNAVKSAIFSGCILAGLPILFLLFHYWKGWPRESSLTVLLIGIFILGILPILLALLDILIERGGKIELKYFTIDFSKFTQLLSPEITIPANIGVRGMPIYESNTQSILDALKDARQSDIVIIDIEDGKAWWETRLFVLLAGSVRLGVPNKVVFVSSTPGQELFYIGWAKPLELFEILLTTKPDYKRYYFVAKAAANQWGLIEPQVPQAPPNNLVIPYPFAFSPAANRNYIAFDASTGMPGEFMQEQFLQAELGQNIETTEHQKGTLNITVGKLIKLFNNVLKKDQLDETWTKEEQARVFFSSESPHLILTNNGKYLRMVSRLSILSEMFKNLVYKKDQNN